MAGQHGENDHSSAAIAVIGLDCKFAGDASNLERLWRMLVEARNAWTAVPSRRFNLRGHFHPDSEKLGTSHVRGGHFIDEDLRSFDPEFFNLSAEAASALDPQYRLQLESAYLALENAALPVETVMGSKTSVFAGTFFHDYSDSMMRDPDRLPRFWSTGTGAAMASNIISHFFDLRGPSMSISTGCSSSLVALHYAVQSLRNGDADMSLVGGSNALLNADVFKTLGSLGFLSPDGKSYAFDSRANGYGRGEGVATVVLKRLEDAIAADDPIRAVIRETATNHDGRTPTITSPSQVAQERLMRQCYRNAGLDPLDTQYVEAHGTGTKVGDSIEARAIATVLRPQHSSTQPSPVPSKLYLGSIKPNIGHTEAASGLASLIKVVLSLENEVIPANVNFDICNPEMQLADWGLTVPTRPQPWSIGPAGIRRASINNFGYGGSNAHAIVEAAPPDVSNDLDTAPDDDAFDGTGLLVLSAKSRKAVTRMVENLKEHLEIHGSDVDRTFPQRLLYTLAERRSKFDWTIAWPVPIAQGAGAIARAISTATLKPRRAPARAPRIGMVFTGQGAQWHAMGRELIDAYPSYGASLREADGILRSLGADWSLMEELGRDAATTRVDDGTLSIPVCVAVQISLAVLLRSWEIVPTAVVGHSSGEIAAAHVAGAIDFRTALAIAYHRSALVARLRDSVESGMIAVGLGTEDAEVCLRDLGLEDSVAVACVNSPRSVTLSGGIEGIGKIEAHAAANGVFARRLKVDVGYHSRYMLPVTDEYGRLMREVLTAPRAGGTSEESIRLSSSVTGRRVYGWEEVVDSEHWVKSMIQPVEFVEAFKDLLLGDDGESGTSVDLVVEVGPHAALKGPIAQILDLPEFDGTKLPYFASLIRGENGQQSMQNLAANLLCQGCNVRTIAVNFPRGRGARIKSLTNLPSYPWNHDQKYWSDHRVNRAYQGRDSPPHDLLGCSLAGVNPSTPAWRNHLRLVDLPWLRDHVIQSDVVFPGAGYISLVIEAATRTAAADTASAREIQGYRLRDIEFVQVLVVPENPGSIEIQTSFWPAGDAKSANEGWARFEICSMTPDDRWTCHARGAILVTRREDSSPIESSVANATSAREFGYARRADPARLFAALKVAGIAHGPSFRNITAVLQDPDHLRGTTSFRVADSVSNDPESSSYIIHPTTIDSILVSAYSAIPDVESGLSSPQIPVSIDKLWISNSMSRVAGHSFHAQSELVDYEPSSFSANLAISDNTETGPRDPRIPILAIKGLRCKSLGSSTAFNADRPVRLGICNRLRWERYSSCRATTLSPPVEMDLSRQVMVEDPSLRTNLRRACMYYIDDAFSSLDSAAVSRLSGNAKDYHTWMENQMALAAAGMLGKDSATWANDDAFHRQCIIETVGSSSTHGHSLCKLGPHISAILRGQISPFEVAAKDSIPIRSTFELVARSQAANIVGRLARVNPRARILEIEAGMGSTSKLILEALGQSDGVGPLAAFYHLTNSHDYLFETLKNHLGGPEEIMAYDTLDTSRDPGVQGFQVQSYDVVIANQSLGESDSVARILAISHSLLKPNGKVLLVGSGQTRLEEHFVSGLFPAEQASTDATDVQGMPSVSQSLDQMFSLAGFGTPFVYQDDDAVPSVLLAEPLDTTLGPPSVEHLLLVISGSCRPPPSWLLAFEHSLGCGTAQVTTHELGAGSSTIYHGKTCILLSDMERPALTSLDEPRWEAIKLLATSSKKLMWVTRGGAMECCEPYAALAIGFLRALRNEYVGRQYVSLDVDPQKSVWSEESAHVIGQVARACFGRDDDVYDPCADPRDFEFAERNGAVYVPRYYEDSARNRDMRSDVWNTHAIAEGPPMQPVRDVGGGAGIPSDSETHPSDPHTAVTAVEKSTIPTEMLEIDSRATNVTRYGTGVLHGKQSGDETELICSGVVTHLGADAMKHGFRVGDRVSCVLIATPSMPIRVSWKHALHVPAGWSFGVAASMLFDSCVAYLCLLDIVCLQRGDDMIVTNASSGLGRLAVQLGQNIGANVYVTARSSRERALIMDEHGLPADHVFEPGSKSFKTSLHAVTSDRGANVVFDTTAGVNLREFVDALAPLGHYIAPEAAADESAMQVLGNKSISFSRFRLLDWIHARGSDIHRTLMNVSRLVTDGVLSPATLRNKNAVGRVVDKDSRVCEGNRQHEATTVARHPTPTRRLRLDPDKCYLVVGGLGHVGRSIVQWLASCGAKFVDVMSRDPKMDKQTHVFTTQLELHGCTIEFVKCDVSNYAELKEAMDVRRQKGRPPFGGIIQAAAVFRDSVLELMPLADFEASLKPKVQGSHNLDWYFRDMTLDFFIMLSSINGITGNASQSNYAAGNAYQDALAWERVTRGLPGVSINLGGIKMLGEFNNVAGLAERLEKLGSRLLSESEMLRVIESAIISPHCAQIITGIDAGAGPHWDTGGLSQLGRDARFAALRPRPSVRSGSSGDDGVARETLEMQLSGASSEAEMERIVRQAITRKLANIFSLALEDVDLDKHPGYFGVDSLIAVDLRNFLGFAEIAVFDIMQSLSLATLAREAAHKVWSRR